MLVRHLDIEPDLSANAESLGGLLEELERRCQGFGDSICDETGKIRTYVNIFVNGEKVDQDADVHSVALSDRDEVYILASVAGGIV